MINIPNPEKKERTVTRNGQCSRCSDFGILKKSIWNDPYTDMDGIGWLCDSCIEKTEHLRAKYNFDSPVVRKMADFSKDFNPVPKPIFKKKKDRKSEE
jgi:hypothetical protein